MKQVIGSCDLNGIWNSFVKQSTNHNGNNSKSCSINITKKQTDIGRKIKSINNTYVNIIFWIFKWVTVNIQARAMCYAVDVHMKRLWTIWKIIILCWQHQKYVGSTIIIVSSKRVKGKNVSPHQIWTIRIDGNNLFGMFIVHRDKREKKINIKQFYLTFDIFSDLCMRWKARCSTIISISCFCHELKWSVFQNISIGIESRIVKMLFHCPGASCSSGEKNIKSIEIPINHFTFIEMRLCIVTCCFTWI